MSKQYHNDTELKAAVETAIPELVDLTTTAVSLTADLTPLTHHAPTTPDYAIAQLTNTTPYGFVSSDEGETVLKVLANVQARLAEVEAQLIAAGILA